MSKKRVLVRRIIFLAILISILFFTKQEESDFKQYVNFNHKQTMGVLYENKSYLFFDYYAELHHLGDEPDVSECYFLGKFGNTVSMGTFGYAHQ